MVPAFAALVCWFVFSAMAVIYAIVRLAFSRNDIDARPYGALLLGGLVGLAGAFRVWLWMFTGPS